MIRALIFDCFGVLYRDNVSLLYDAVPLEKHTELHDIIHAIDYGYINRQEYYERIAELGGKAAADIQAIELRQHVRDDAMIAYTQTFKPRYKIALLSNIDSGTALKMFPEPQRSELFDAAVISGELGVTKPSREIYDIAARRLGVQPEECLMIDDLPKNVEGARVAGMHSLLFTTQRQLERDLGSILAKNKH